MPTAAPAAALEGCREEVEVTGENLAGNFRKNFSELRNVIISGCGTRIEAKLARFSKFDFEDSRWTFEGNVRIDMDDQNGRLRADEAVVNFRDNQLSRVEITGSPAEFEQKRTDSNAVARGRAGEIVYELGPGTVSLSKDAWLTDGSTEIKNPQIVYDIRRQQVQASSRPGSERVRITIKPGATGRTNDKTPAPPATPTP